jgi:hypothetical protein
MLMAWKREIELEESATARVRFLCICEARIKEPRRGGAESPSITVPGSCVTNWLSHTCIRKAVTFCTSVVSATPCSAVLDGTLHQTVKYCNAQVKGRLKLPPSTVGAYFV